MKNFFAARNGSLTLFSLPPILVMVIITLILLILALGGEEEFFGLPAAIIAVSALGVVGTILITFWATRKLNEQESNLIEQIRNQQQALIDLDAELSRLKSVNQALEQPQNIIARQENDENEKFKLECESVIAENRRLEMELKLLKEVLAALGSKKSPTAILEVVCRELALAFGVGQCAAALVNEEQNSLTVVAEYLSEGFTSARNFVIPVDGNPATLYVLKNKVPLAIYDAQRDILLAPIQDIMKERGSASLLLLPILVNGNAVGTIGLDSAAPREFSDSEIAMVSRVMGAVACALECSWGQQDNL